MEGWCDANGDWRLQHLPRVRYHSQRERRRRSHYGRLEQSYSRVLPCRSQRGAGQSRHHVQCRHDGGSRDRRRLRGGRRVGGGCSKVVQDVPPFMLADGNPAETRTVNKVGMERHGVPEPVQTALRMAYKILFREGLTIPNALARIEAELPPSPEIQHFVQFVRRSERGVSK